MSDHRPADPSTVDALEALLRRGRGTLSRRDLLTAAARVGALAAVAPLAAACGTSATATPVPSPSAAASAPPSTAPSVAGSATPAPSPSPSPSPTPVPSPEAELFVYNWADYMGPDVVKSFQDKFGIKVTMDFFPDYDTMNAKIASGASGYDITFPSGVDVPGLLARKLVQPLDLTQIPAITNLGPEWQNPAYDPGNQHSIPYMWWTTGFAYDSAKVKSAPTSWSTLWDEKWKGHISMLDDYREVFAVALFRLGKSANTTSTDDLDAALQLLEQQKPLLRTYTTDDIQTLSSGDAWICHAWSGDVYQVTPDRPSVKFVLPEEGAVRGSDTMVLLAGAQHPVAAHLFINYMLDPQISAANTNTIGYMGPNQAAKQYIDPAILADPTVNPSPDMIAKLQELQDLGADLQQYHDRWSKLRAGA